jgi:hypothetical protein
MVATRMHAECVYQFRHEGKEVLGAGVGGLLRHSTHPRFLSPAAQRDRQNPPHWEAPFFSLSAARSTRSVTKCASKSLQSVSVKSVGYRI